MSYVIDNSAHGGGAFLCLLMIANHADRFGRNAFPGVPVLAQECRMSERQIYRLLDELERSGELKTERAGGGRGKVKGFRIVMGNPDKMSPFMPADKSTETLTSEHEKGDISGQERVTFAAPIRRTYLKNPEERTGAGAPGSVDNSKTAGERHGDLSGKYTIDPNGCWLWSGAIDPNGYGAIKIAGEKRGAHRVSFELYRGEIPAGLDLDHLCRIHHCINPDHLEPVSRSINIQRGDRSGQAKINSEKIHCPTGHEYNPANTYYRKDGSRDCKACRRQDNPAPASKPGRKLSPELKTAADPLYRSDPKRFDKLIIWIWRALKAGHEELDIVAALQNLERREKKLGAVDDWWKYLEGDNGSGQNMIERARTRRLEGEASTYKKPGPIKLGDLSALASLAAARKR